MTSSTDGCICADIPSTTAEYPACPMHDEAAPLRARLVAAEAALATANMVISEQSHLLADAIGDREDARAQLADANKRIEEMTADQPAIRADERTRIAAEIEREGREMVGFLAANGSGSDVRHRARLIGAEDAYKHALRIARESADGPSVPGLSVCVAQLAAIRQLAKSGSFVTWTNRVAIYADDLFAVLDGVPVDPAEPRWIHDEDGSDCPEAVPLGQRFGAKTPTAPSGAMWWCTTHQMRLRWLGFAVLDGVPGTTQGNGSGDA